jgi:hypothetical protein
MSLRALSWRIVVPSVLLLVATGGTAYALQADGPALTGAAADVTLAAPEDGAAPATQVVRWGVQILKSDPRSRLTSTGLDLWEVSQTTSFDLPEAASRAYHHAADVESPCGIPWWLLAGIGRVESNHGRFGGAVLDAQGVSHPAIIGIPLDGHGPVAAIHDTDGGRWDGDKIWDRAVGPMQFIPSTWAWAGRDGDGDGVATPNDLDDAALAAAAYLCRFGSLTSEDAQRRAVFSYNHSDYYVDLVLAFGHGYETGSFEIPSPPALDVPAADVPADAPAAHSPGGQTPAAHAPTATTASPNGGSTGSHPGSQPTSGTSAPPPTGGTNPAPGPSQPPAPTSSADPTPGGGTSSPPAPQLVALTGVWDVCTGGWCLDGTLLDLGPDTQLDAVAASDYDGNGTVDTNRQEFAGLAGKTLTVQVDQGTAVVYVIDGHDYRNADGTFR